MNFSALRPPPAYLVTICVTGLAAWGYMPGSLQPPKRAAAEDTTVSAASAPSGHPSLYNSSQDYSQDVLSRPLMFAGRRVPDSMPANLGARLVPTPPVAVLPQTTAAAVEPRPDVLFKGYVYASGRPQSLLKWGADGNEEWLAIGATHEGWRIEAISSKEVILRKGSDQFSIKLYE
jgi:hypothetical protein